MFVFQEEPTFTANVRIHVPTDAGGKLVQQAKGKFKVITPERVTEICTDALNKRARGEEYSDDARRILEEVLVGWEDIKVGGKDGPDLEFSDVNRDKLIAIPYVRSAFSDAYFEGVSGKARKGN